MTGPDPLLVVGHGTRDADGAAEFRRFVARVARRAAPDGLDVAGGFIELSGPPVAEAVADLVGRGHRRLVAVPLLLVAAGHGKGDIPAAMAREQVRHRGLRYRYGRPLGPHPTLLSLLEERVEAVRQPRGGGAGRSDTAVILVGRGSTDPDGNAEVSKVARLLWEGRGYAFVETAFVSLAWPSVPEALERARRLGARRVVVAPYLLFPGVLPDRVVAQARAYAAQHAGLEVRAAGLIGDCDALADLVLERYREALTGDIRMNCDTCVYRVAMPGNGSRVGQPQTPHDHPDDRTGHTHSHGAALDHHGAAHGPDHHDTAHAPAH